MHTLTTIYKQKQNKTVLKKYLNFNVGGQHMDFFNGGSVIMDSYFGQKQLFEVKTP